MEPVWSYLSHVEFAAAQAGGYFKPKSASGDEALPRSHAGTKVPGQDVHVSVLQELRVILYRARASKQIKSRSDPELLSSCVHSIMQQNPDKSREACGRIQVATLCKTRGVELRPKSTLRASLLKDALNLYHFLLRDFQVRQLSACPRGC